MQLLVAVLLLLLPLLLEVLLLATIATIANPAGQQPLLDVVLVDPILAVQKKVPVAMHVGGLGGVRRGTAGRRKFLRIHRCTARRDRCHLRRAPEHGVRNCQRHIIIPTRQF